MIKSFVPYLVLMIGLTNLAKAQVSGAGRGVDTTRNNFNIPEKQKMGLRTYENPFLVLPENIKREVTYDPENKRYIITEKLGDKLYSAPQYLSIEQYLRLVNSEIKRDNWRVLSNSEIADYRRTGIIPTININSKAFEKIFGGSTIDIQPSGEAEFTFLGRIDKNENPMFNERQRKQTSFDFNQRIQMDLAGSIGTKMKLKMNYNTEAQFDFENQIKLEYTGGKDDIIKKIEAGNVNLPLNTSLINGTQALFGVKTQLQFGKLNLSAVFTQQKSQSKQIQINNGAQQNEFNVSASEYEANKHYFLAHFFRNTYNKSMINAPVITSGIQITKMEVWITNKTGASNSKDSRDVLAFMDLGENNPYNTAQITGGKSPAPAGFNSLDFPVQSNDLLSKLPANARYTNANDVNTFFQANGGTDNFAKIIYARKLTDKEFTYHPQLGYISLNMPLNNDEILAVSYRYTYSGKEYQVGEFSTDVPQDLGNPKVLFAKLLKNEVTKTRLPIWDLMMKNIYNIGGYGINPNKFKLDVYRLDDNTGIERPIMMEGANTQNKLYINLLGLDRLNQQQERKPDGVFDFITENSSFSDANKNQTNPTTAAGPILPNNNSANPLVSTNTKRGYITIDPLNGRVIFPVIEPFGKDFADKFNQTSEQILINKYAYPQLYDSVKLIAQQLFPNKNRYVIKGNYQSDVSSEFSLNSINVPEGSVKVFAGSIPLVEGADFVVDYQIGRVRIINPALLSSGQPIRISTENNETFGLVQRSLFGLRADYRVNNKLNIGSTFMSLSEKPISAKVNYGEEPIANKMYGFDINYTSPSRFLTKMIDKLPLISTKEKSSFNFYGEFAQLLPGHPSALNYGKDKGGASYLDDFEAATSIIDLKSAIPWQISGTPQLFTEAKLNDDLAYGYNRAKVAFYNIDPTFFKIGTSNLPSSLLNNTEEMSNHYVRRVDEKEVFPYKEIPKGQLTYLPTLDVAYYPMLRGPYNYTTTGFNLDGTLLNPKNRWGGLMRKIDVNDFEAQNVEFIDFWVMDPFLYKPSSQGGDLYINIGNISEDILKDGRKSLENGLPATDDPSRYDETNWGRVPKQQPVIAAFDNDPATRKAQDVGLDGLSNVNERGKFGSIVAQIKAQLNPTAGTAFEQDPSSDDYSYFRGGGLDQTNAGVLKRYENYNGTDGNAKTSSQSIAELGLENSASTALPDGEDINRDNNMTQSDEYFQYKISMRPSDLVVGKNFISDKIVSLVELENKSKQNVTWYQIRIPIAQYQDRIGGIQDFKSIRFLRMFLTNFADTAVLRFGKIQLVRGDWRLYNPKNEVSLVIADPAISTPSADKSIVEVSTVNIEENGRRYPVPYVVPPGIARERDFSNYQGDARQNEQALAVTFKEIKDGYGRAVFKTAINDFRTYKRLQMFVHAEALGNAILKDNDLQAFIRVGTDNKENYYEYNQPLKVTQPGTTSPDAIWPEANRMNVELAHLTQAKLARNKAKTASGAPWPINEPFIYSDGENQIIVKGQPDLSKVRIYMLGVKNPLRNAASPASDDGLDKSAVIWFNELRLTDFDERGSWAATARMTTKLADFADLNISASKATIGFGSLEQRVSERNKTDNQSLDISSNIELGKLLPAKSGIKIPMFVSYSKQILTPQFDPRTPDVELKEALKNASRSERDSILNFAQDNTSRSSIAFTNVRKERAPDDKKIRPWDIENFNVTYAQTNYNHRDFINENAIQRTYKASLAYNFAYQGKNYKPFEKLIKSNTLRLLRDFNFTLMPKSIILRMDLDRFYSENTLRNNDPYNSFPISTTYSKNFLLSRVYGVSWDLSKSLSLDFNATNYSVVDEPDGRIVGLKRDTLWNNIKRLGRNVNYAHDVAIRYNLPINKIPGLDWIDVAASYGTNFNWQTEPLSTLNNPEINLGNTIQNARNLKVSPLLDFAKFYNKIGLGKKEKAKKELSFGNIMISLLTSLRDVKVDFLQTRGTFLPGYIPKTNYFGLDKLSGAPGWPFVFGSQRDIRPLAANNGWITQDTLQTQLYVNTLQENFQLVSNLTPLPGLNIVAKAIRTRTFNYSSNFRYDVSSGSFANYTPITTGAYSISTFLLKTSFSDKIGSTVSKLYKQFMDNRQIISQRLGAQNPNSRGVNNNFADGYGKTSQDVLVTAFLAAYTGKDPSSASLNNFPSIPIPNWEINYDGLIKIPFISERFESLSLRHNYLSAYSVNGFNNLLRYEEYGGFSRVRDADQNFLPQYQFSQISLTEQFYPLIGVDAVLKNRLTAKFEMHRNRMLSLSLANSQLASESVNGLVLGLGYRATKFRLPFGILQAAKTDNDVNFKLDVSVRDNKVVIYQPDIDYSEVSSGAKNITLRPTIDCIINQRYNVRLFYDANITKPYTSQSFTTSYSNFGFSFRLTLN